MMNNSLNIRSQCCRTNLRSVNVHIKTVHEGVYTPATCPICGMTFKTKLQMNRHHILMHSTDQGRTTARAILHFPAV